MLEPFVTINNMLGTSDSVRKYLTLCLALCMPCQAICTAHCMCMLDCCQCESAEYGECVNQSNCSCCSKCDCSLSDDGQSPGQPCRCEYRGLPPYGLPLSQVASSSLSESLGVSLLSCTTPCGLDLSRQQAIVDTQSTSCTVQQPCIFFCRFLL